MHKLERDLREKEWFLDFREQLEAKKIPWIGGGKAANKTLNDIRRHQMTWKDGNNEWVEIGSRGFSISNTRILSKAKENLEEAGLIQIKKDAIVNARQMEALSDSKDALELPFSERG